MRTTSKLILIALGVTFIAMFFCGVLSAHCEDKASGNDAPHIEYCEEIGQEFHVCPELLEAILEASSLQPGQVGPMHLFPYQQWDRMERMGLDDLTDVKSSIAIGADYLLELYEAHESTETVLKLYFGLDPKEDSEFVKAIADRAYLLEELHGKLEP